MQPVPDDTGYWEIFAAEQQTGGRDDCIPHFYMRAVRNPARSEERGRPVFDEIAYVRVLVPGDRNSVVDRRVSDADRARWPDRWAAFEARRERPTGTPIEHWPYLTVAGVAAGWASRISARPRRSAWSRTAGWSPASSTAAGAPVPARWR